ncbi:MAG: N-acetyltransferase, partial [Roseburia sp.]|nr:N-acetyltransferase [Roseburia sp.]
MIEMESLILDKAKYSDWKEMYCNVWSQSESAKYMAWNITTNEEDAKIRIMKTIAFQKAHYTYLVYDKATGKAIG